MNSLIENKNLKVRILDKLNENIGHRLKNYVYYDICSEDQLTTNNNGIDIVSHQLELEFESINPIFISWDTFEDWHQYSLSISEKTFCNGAEKYTKIDKNWESILGRKLVDFQVYGYKENVISTTEMISGKSKSNTYYNEPHLLVLEFDNEKVLGIANFYLEDNFVPRLPMGDDIWIIFDRENLKCCIDNLNLDKLDK